MRSEHVYPVLKAALWAGLAAGLLLGLFHLVLTEPVIDRAIALEGEAAKPPGQAARYEPAVSREVQKVGLVAGSTIYGLLVGLLFAAVLVLVGQRLPGPWPHVKVAALAGLLWWSAALLPSLKYPANPPGVGDPETAVFRQALQVSFIVLSVLAVAAAAAFYWFLGRRWRHPEQRERRLGLAVGLYGVLAVLLLVAFPPNPDPVTAPADLVWDFRILAIAGQALFWAVLGGVSALLLRRSSRKETWEKAG